MDPVKAATKRTGTARRSVYPSAGMGFEAGEGSVRPVPAWL